MPSRNYEQKLCKYFASSSGEGCRHGAMCKFSHQLPPIQVPESEVHTLQPQGEGESHELTLTTDRSQGADRNKTSANSRRPCRYYSKGVCRDGDNCRFRHVKKVAPKQEKHQQEQSKSKRQVCKYFVADGGCRLGDRCRYLHKEKASENQDEPPNSRQEVQNETQKNEVEENANITVGDQNTNMAANEKRKSKGSYHCKYFNSPRGCRLRDNCRYLHANKEENTQSQDVPEVAEPERKQRKRLLRPKKRMGYLETDISDMTESDQEELRENEVTTLRRKYKAIDVPRERGSGSAHQITFVPSDSEWPYDLQSIIINLYFPPLYPKKMMEVTIPAQDGLPETVRKCVYFSLIDWVEARYRSFENKGRVERVFRPFIRWLDSELEDIFTDALTHYKRELEAKAAGIEIIPARHLQARFQQASSSEDESSSSEEDSDEDDGYYYDGSYEVLEQAHNFDNDPEDLMWNTPVPDNKTSTKSDVMNFDSVPKGTEIRLRDLQLGEFVGTLSVASVKLQVRCVRCKETGEVSSPPDRLNQLVCSKCNNTQLIKYRPALMHCMSAVVGHLDLEQCTATDLLLMDCDFVANCLRCNRDKKLGGIPPGPPKTTWCTSCHAKIIISTEGVQFRNLQPTTIEETESAFRVTGSKVPRNVRDPNIKLGQPLPNNGTCKHFKKSFRWLRFPCCGKTYPCDICHDEKEDHEQKFANRMVCGFCAHEQTYSGDKPCSSCKRSMTGRSTSHWEGGKGCRDATKMSRADNKKYTNINKTESRKSQSKSQPNKKAVRLRHA